MNDTHFYFYAVLVVFFIFIGLTYLIDRAYTGRKMKKMKLRRKEDMEVQKRNRRLTDK